MARFVSNFQPDIPVNLSISSHIFTHILHPQPYMYIYISPHVQKYEVLLKAWLQHSVCCACLHAIGQSKSHHQLGEMPAPPTGRVTLHTAMDSDVEGEIQICEKLLTFVRNTASHRGHVKNLTFSLWLLQKLARILSFSNYW